MTHQLLAAKYLYDPYGNMLAMSGPLMNFNRYRFSSKEWNDSSGLYYYGYRLYDPILQRWVNRDPIQELMGPNLYEYVGNNPETYIDLDGRMPPAPPPSTWAGPYLNSPVSLGGTAGAGGVIGGSTVLVVGGIVVASAAALGFGGADAYQGYQWYQLDQQNEQAQENIQRMENYLLQQQIQNVLDEPNFPIELPKFIDPDRAKAESDCMEQVEKYKNPCKKRNDPLSKQEVNDFFRKCMKGKGHDVE